MNDLTDMHLLSPVNHERHKETVNVNVLSMSSD